ncbi:ImmA/IrrE family metallo-endopeptidase [Alkalicoccobacillus gibsonii]|uniref:ImmA/IrrE family metallo-endopeptidase n=1 Tax=Alkalicoccobacillus gibsonii TaxID=79881 RepID=UPI00193433D3|nr:ImmA/IrrE family metallo-endopeptidase [Alkalicoccobacillus gibsonii]MBM0064975.1 ImmA/IrrE family metallo-endopeptidase [Alkalicoccobacillus gibsonii]
MRFSAHTFRDKEVSKLLSNKGINSVNDLSTDHLSTLLDTMVIYEPSASRVRSVEDFTLITLDSRLNRLEQRREFFHELTHALFHPGDQQHMSPELSRFQEEQANYLMLYLAMPLHLFEPVLLKYQSLVSLQEMFDLPQDMISSRIESLRRERSRSSYQTKLQRIEWQYRKKSLRPGEIHGGTIQILQQLKNQVGEERMSSDVTRLL